MAANSSSNIEARLSQIQIDLDEVKLAIHKLESKQIRLQKTGTSRWECMNQELKELREEIFEDIMTSMKDLANFSSGIGNWLAELEKKVEAMLKEHGKTPKIQR